jgi:diadenosine tetraphosphate (Ap4A) HIT family hydrolase
VVRTDCFICRKHRGEVALAGGPIHADDLLFAAHAWETPHGVPEDVYVGRVFVETKRHAAAFADLSAEEAAAVGVLASRLSRAMRNALGADFVFAAVIGTGVPHFHLHLVARYPETPADVPWHGVDEWSGAPRGGEDEIAAASERIRAALA